MRNVITVRKLKSATQGGVCEASKLLGPCLQGFFKADGEGRLTLSVAENSQPIFELRRSQDGAYAVVCRGQEYAVTLVTATLDSFGGARPLADNSEKMSRLAAGFFELQSIGGIDFYHGATHVGRISVMPDDVVRAAMKLVPVSNLVP